MRNLIGSLLLFLSLSTASHAATVGFGVEDSYVGLGNTFSIDIVGGDLFPETQGGGVNLFYDQSIVNVLSINIDSAVWNFVNDLGATDNVTGKVSDILVSAFNGSGSGPSGSFVMATILLEAVGPGVSSLSMTESSLNPWGSFGSAVNPTYLTGTVTVSEVPLPGAIWLFVGGFVMLFGSVRRQF